MSATFTSIEGMSSIGHIVVVVLNWCAEEDTTRAIGSVLEHGGSGVTVLLVDNASPDGSGPRLHARFPDVPYLQTGANLGYAGGNQRGIEWAMAQGADAVLLMNDDAELHPGCLPALCEALDADPKLGGCAPTIAHGPPHDDRVWWGGGRFSAQHGCGLHLNSGRTVEETQRYHRERAVPVSALNGCVLLLRTSALRAKGGLDESYFCYNEDSELTLRLHAGGWGTAWIPHAVAVHHLPFPEPPASPWAITQLDRNRRRLAARHLSGSARAAFAARYYTTRCLRIVTSLLRGDRERVLAYWRGMTSAL